MGMIFYSHLSQVKGNVTKHFMIIMGLIAANGEKCERNPLPSTVKALRLIALMRTRISRNAGPR
jgi:hypothetical protein